MNERFFLERSKIFQVYSLRRNTCDQRGCRNDATDNYYIEERFTPRMVARFEENMGTNGLCICGGLAQLLEVEMAKVSLCPLIDSLISKYDILSDEFVDVEQDSLGIVRMPRIGRGKHNIHFDPYMSDQHAALERLAKESHFTEVLSAYMNADCVIRESGVSITRPSVANGSFVTPADCTNFSTAGEGMEWHSDGPKGEATILMSLWDIDSSVGSLRVVPGSHLRYIDGVQVGCDEVSEF